MHDDHDVATLAALHATRETGVLDALLEDADGPREVAATTGVPERAASVLVDVLADRGFFERVDDAYEPTNRALGLLTKTDLRSIGATPHRIDRFACYAALAEELAGDGNATTSDGNATTGDDADAGFAARRREHRPGGFDRNRLGAVQATPDATVHAAVSAAVRAVPDPGRVLDLGGAPGPYATEFAARGRDVVLRDRPDAVDAARPLLAPRAIDLDPGPLDADLPSAALAFASDLAPRLDRGALADAYAAVHDALTASDHTSAETAFVAVEHVRGRTAGAATRRLDALATGDPGDVPTEPALRDALHDAGFEAVELRAVPGLDRVATVACPRRT